MLNPSPFFFPEILTKLKQLFKTGEKAAFSSVQLLKKCRKS